jgi:S-adenosylmethionine:tRNA ribosyltransferase-isomerase
VLVSDFHYELPEELIAQEPLADRAGSRLLHVDSTQAGGLEDRQFREFPELLRPGDVVVFNNTRVFPARLYGRRSGVQLPHPSRSSGRAFSQRTREMERPGIQNPHPFDNPRAGSLAKDARRMGHPAASLLGRIEVLLTRQVQPEPNEWECLVRPGRKIGVGEGLLFGEHDELQAEVIGRGEFGERRIRFAALPGFARSDSRGRLSPHNPESAPGKDFFGLVERIGHIPLPPYISREDSGEDRERYQTVYARERGSVAAPTAGLHFTPEILAGMRKRGIETAEVTLHVGLGTFQPVRVERVEEHRLHSEAYSISVDAADSIRRARKESRRIVAVGTTTVRTLEFAAQQGAGEVRAGSGEANLFIYPGYRFHVVRALLTNFHLPQSTLLMLVCALGGKQNVMRAYEHAVRERYRFYSYGDCMFVE